MIVYLISGDISKLITEVTFSGKGYELDME